MGMANGSSALLCLVLSRTQTNIRIQLEDALALAPEAANLRLTREAGQAAAAAAADWVLIIQEIPYFTLPPNKCSC